MSSKTGFFPHWDGGFGLGPGQPQSKARRYGWAVAFVLWEFLLLFLLAWARIQ